MSPMSAALAYDPILTGKRIPPAEIDFEDDCTGSADQQSTTAPSNSTSTQSSPRAPSNGSAESNSPSAQSSEASRLQMPIDGHRVAKKRRLVVNMQRKRLTIMGTPVPIMPPERISSNMATSVPVAVDADGQLVKQVLPIATIDPKPITDYTALAHLPSPLELPADAKFRMEAVASLKDGYWQLAGDWWRSDVDSQRASPFSWSGSRQSDGTSITSGHYIGWCEALVKSEATRTQEFELQLDFVRNSEKGYNISGFGANRFGKYRVLGVVDCKLRASMVKMFSGMLEGGPFGVGGRLVTQQQMVRLADYMAMPHQVEPKSGPIRVAGPIAANPVVYLNGAPLSTVDTISSLGPAKVSNLRPSSDTKVAADWDMARPDVASLSRAERVRLRPQGCGKCRYMPGCTLSCYKVRETAERKRAERNRMKEAKREDLLSAAALQR